MLIGHRRVLRTSLLVFVAGVLALAAVVLAGASPASAADPCSAGSYFDGSACVLASPGFFVPNAGATSETPCPAGTFQPNSGAVSCLNATPGNFVPTSGQATQTACPAGTFQPGSGAVSCLNATPGNFVPTSGQVGQTPCGTGTFQPGFGAASCLDAQPGHFVPTAGQATQTACGTGTFQPGFGAASCLDAQPGHFVATAGQASETACAPGTYQPASGAAGCIAASVNFYVPDSAATAQLPCPDGTYQPLTGQSSCIPVPCPQGTKANFRWHYSANGSSGSWSGTKTQTCSGSFSMGPQAMEGNLQVAPGATLRAGYDFTLPGNKNSLTMTVSAAQVTFAVACVSGATPSSPTLTVTLTDQTYQITNDQWYPSGDQSSPLVYQGSVTVPDLCGGGTISLAKGGTFTATLG